ASTSFGYLEMGEMLATTAGGVVREVKRFVEKPDAATAQRYLDSGMFAWNAGMFFWRVDTFLDEAARNAPALAAFVRDFPKSDWGPFLAEHFPTLPKISVDYAIMEKAQAVETLLSEFDWDDVGLWTALPKHLPTDAAGNTTRGPVLVA